ncbi:MAG: membrane dipeptidase [Chloroflexota bacterium]
MSSYRDLHHEAIIIDPCVQFLINRSERSDRSGLTAAGLTIPMPGDDMAQALARVRAFLAIIAAEPTFCLADQPQAIVDAKQQGKLAHILLAQDSLFIGHNLDNLLLWKQLGLRVMQLTYNEQNLAGSGCLERHDGGLTQYGRILIREMETVGITLDLTHVGEKTFMETLEVATQPLLASHSNPKSVVDNPRNINDDQIKGIAASGGVICVTTWAPLIWDGSPGMPTLDDYLRCLEYVIDLVGIEHAGISTDSMGTWGAYPQHDPDPDALPYGSVTDEFDQIAEPEDNNNRQPSDFNGIEDYPILVKKMVERGYGEENIKKLLGGNLLRLFEATWKPEFFT